MHNKSKVLLLNLPYYDHLYIRSYFCSQISKAYYYPPPADFVCLSAILSKNGYDLSYIDCVVDRIGYDKLLELIIEGKPDTIIVLVGTLSFNHDVRMIEKIKKLVPSVRICAIGDVFISEASLSKETNVISAIIHDFTS